MHTVHCTVYIWLPKHANAIFSYEGHVVLISSIVRKIEREHSYSLYLGDGPDTKRVRMKRLH